MNDGTTLLTGATGLLGQYLLRDLLLRGVPLAVLVRAGAGQSAPARLEEIVTRWEARLGRRLPRPRCLEGDLTAPGLGLSAEALGWAARHCRQVVHNGASLTFYGADRGRDPWLTNVTGTAHLLAFCRAAEVSSLHYVSTAYVCGKRPGPVAEDDPPGDEFRNDYEASKAEAERLVCGAAGLGSVTVHRPAVIVGDSATGYTSTYHGLYAYPQFVWLLARYARRDAQGRWHVPVRLNATGEERRNLVPVDWVSAVIAHLVARPEHHGRTYHLTPERPITAREIEAAMAEYFNYYGPTFAGPDALRRGDLNDLEKEFYEYVGRYAPYWQEEPRFDCANTRAAAPHLPCPPVDIALVRRLIDFAVRDGWGKKRKKRAPAQAAEPAPAAEPTPA